MSADLLSLYAQHAPIDSRAVFIRNPTPRHRPSERGALRPLDLYLLPSRDDQVFDVPANGVDWRADDGVHWAVLAVLPLGVTQASTQSTMHPCFVACLVRLRCNSKFVASFRSRRKSAFEECVARFPSKRKRDADALAVSSTSTSPTIPPNQNNVNLIIQITTRRF